MLYKRQNQKNTTRNTLDCDHQSNYSSRIVFSHITIECGPTRNSAISRPRKPHHRTKHEVERMIPRGDMAI